MKVKTVAAAIAAGAILVGTSALSAAEKAAKKPAQPAMDEKAMMEAWAKYATPGDAHKKLAGAEGSWTVKVKQWMAPGAPPTETDGTSEMKMILGGRYLQQTYEGTMMGQPFTGMGYTGYDNFRKKYVETWMDSSGTSILMMTGTMDAAGKTMTSWGTMDDVMTGKKIKIKSTWTMDDADHSAFAMWGSGPDGKMGKMMEIAYSRKK